VCREEEKKHQEFLDTADVVRDVAWKKPRSVSEVLKTHIATGGKEREKEETRHLFEVLAVE
jgi:hypothetical protein